MTDKIDVSYRRLVEIRQATNPAAPKMVLVVEDDERSRNALAHALQNDGYEVVAVENGLQALDHLRWTWQPDCVLLDMRMPVMTGWELRVAMKADPRLRDIPVIGMTGGRWKPEDEEGFAALIAKPIDFEELKDGLTMVLKRGVKASPQ